MFSRARRRSAPAAGVAQIKNLRYAFGHRAIHEISGLNRLLIAALWLCLTAPALSAGTNDFFCQTITLPTSASMAGFADIDGDDLADLLAPDPVAKTVLIYRQRATSFPNAPDQAIPLLPQTAWVAPCDVDAHPGLELLMSTASGLVYCRQNSGVFDTTLRTLIQAGQVFTNDDACCLILLATNTSVPVVSASQAVMCQRNSAFEWSRGQPIPLAVRQTRWWTYPAQWSLGSKASRTVFSQQLIAANPVESAADKPENEAIRKLLVAMKKKSSFLHPPGLQRLDVNGDGAPDLVLWQVVGEIDPRTEVYVFLRGADGRLPDQPIQALRCHGIPIPVGSTYEPTPVADLKGNHTFELVLLELKSKFTSASSLVEMALSRGLDWTFTVRTFRQGGFSRIPDATIPVTTIIPVIELEQWPFFICGDFNGDGRPDFVLRRSHSDWTIVFSTEDERWFAPQPAMSFATRLPGYFEMNDLNGDGRSDIVLRDLDGPRLMVFLTQSVMKGKPR